MSEVTKILPKKDVIKVRGANEHNLRNLSVDIPRNKLVVITGVSGSGKPETIYGVAFFLCKTVPRHDGKA